MQKFQFGVSHPKNIYSFVVMNHACCIYKTMWLVNDKM